MKRILLIIILFWPRLVLSSQCEEALIHDLPSKSSTNEEVVAYIELIKGTALFGSEEVQRSFCNVHSWYEKHMSSGRFSSRILAVLILFLGASLPLITILVNKIPNQKLLISCIGAAIVISQGISQTFQYEESWSYHTVAKLELESAHHEWQQKVIRARINEKE